jgi:hypothetical protein
MKPETESSPLIVLIDQPILHNSCGPEASPPKTVTPMGFDCVWFNMTQEPVDKDPVNTGSPGVIKSTFLLA